MTTKEAKSLARDCWATFAIRKVFYFILFFFALPKKETKKSSPGLFGDVCSIRKVFYFILFFFALPKKETKKSSPGLFGDLLLFKAEMK